MAHGTKKHGGAATKPLISFNAVVRFHACEETSGSTLFKPRADQIVHIENFHSEISEKISLGNVEKFI